MKIKELREYTQWFRDNIPDVNFHFNYHNLDPKYVSSSCTLFHGKQAEAIQSGNICGSIGCFTGHLPNKPTDEGYSQAFAKRFDIDIHIVIPLTHPHEQDVVSDLLPVLGSETTKQEVCDMIDLFCDLVEQGKIKVKPYTQGCYEEDYA